jgi:hypothetical protein
MISMFVAEELQGLKTVLAVHSQYMLSLPARDWYGTNNSPPDAKSESCTESWFSARAKPWPEADALKKVTADVTELQVKIQSELRYAKREVSWGKLPAKDIVTTCRLLKNILVPVFGMESLTAVTDRIEKRGGWGALGVPNTVDSLTASDVNALEDKEKWQWKDILEKMNYPVIQLQRTMVEGLDHSLYTLELAKRPAPSVATDLEANSLECSPGEKGFAKYLENTIQDFLGLGEGLLNEWCIEKGMDAPSQMSTMEPSDYPLHERHQSQLYFILDVSLFCSRRTPFSTV